MQAIKHPRCIALYEVIEDSAAVHLVEELASGGELFDRIIELGHFSESQAVKLIHQVFDGIQYLHTNGMIHRDLKPENLLMVSRDPNSEEFMQLKIADFGLSAQRTEAKSAEEWQKMLQDFCGTQDYLAPEVFTLAATRNKVIDFFQESLVFRSFLLATAPFCPYFPRNACPHTTIYVSCCTVLFLPFPLVTFSSYLSCFVNISFSSCFSRIPLLA